LDEGWGRMAGNAFRRERAVWESGVDFRVELEVGVDGGATGIGTSTRITMSFFSCTT